MRCFSVSRVVQAERVESLRRQVERAAAPASLRPARRPRGCVVSPPLPAGAPAAGLQLHAAWHRAIYFLNVEAAGPGLTRAGCREVPCRDLRRGGALASATAGR